MKIKYLIGVAILIAFGSEACKTKDEPAPIVKIAVSNVTISEGDTVIFLNTTEHATKHEWRCDSLGFSSNLAAPIIVITKSGTYDFLYTATNGDGKTSNGKLTLAVTADTIYRLSNNTQKIWIVKSLKYNGNEMVTSSCQFDDEFTVYKAAQDSCTLTHGKDTCPTGTYLFELPATSQWRWNSNKGTFEFALVAFGSPINLAFKPSVCTTSLFEGADVTNGVSIKLALKK